jgi:hypothetical protein
VTDNTFLYIDYTSNPLQSQVFLIFFEIIVSILLLINDPLNSSPQNSDYKVNICGLDCSGRYWYNNTRYGSDRFDGKDEKENVKAKEQQKGRPLLPAVER